MAGDTMKKVQPGDQLAIPAETFNTFIDTARALRAGGHNLGRHRLPVLRDADTVLVRNNSGADRQRFDVLGIDGVIFSPTDNLDEFQNRPALKGVTPDKDDHIGKFVILLEPVRNGLIARGALGGFRVARVDVTDGQQWYAYADIKHNDATQLAGAPHGAAQVLWKEDGTGTRWAVVRLGTPQGETSYWGKLDGTLLSGGSATVSIYWRAGVTDSTHDVTAYAPRLLSGGSIAAGKWVEVTYRPDAQRWYVTGAQC